ncbi:MAG: hypothetical protein HY721_13715 [Planctomycetes bacterium]|nr:hypothetical protein [Planctomycetota bacterium]
MDFDEEVLRIEALRKLSDYPDTSQGFERLEVNNRNNYPGSAGVDEGFVVGGVVFSFVEDITLPADEDIRFLGLEFLVKAGVPADTTEVRFLDGGRGSGQPVQNNVTVDGSTVLPQTAGSYVFTNGVVTVLPEITAFVRGDSNGDGAVDLSDALSTLGYLFLGAPRPACYDAADADDSGRIDIGDPMLTLTVLFLGNGKTIPQPFPAEGEDPTPDRLGCLHQY